MMKTHGLHPVVLPPVKEFKPVTMNVEQHPRIMHFKGIAQPTPVAEKILKANWPYYALFVPAFMYCAYYKSASGLVWVSILSQAVHYMVNKRN
jgi:hypothetical protein